MIVSCPHCNAENDVPRDIICCCEAYGSTNYAFNCNKCNNGMRVFLNRTVTISQVNKTLKVIFHN